MYPTDLFYGHFGIIHGQCGLVFNLCVDDDVFTRHVSLLVYPEGGADSTLSTAAAGHFLCV